MIQFLHLISLFIFVSCGVNQNEPKIGDSFSGQERFQVASVNLIDILYNNGQILNNAVMKDCPSDDSNLAVNGYSEIRLDDCENGELLARFEKNIVTFYGNSRHGMATEGNVSLIANLDGPTIETNTHWVLSPIFRETNSTSIHHLVGLQADGLPEFPISFGIKRDTSKKEFLHFLSPGHPDNDETDPYSGFATNEFDYYSLQSAAQRSQNGEVQYDQFLYFLKPYFGFNDRYFGYIAEHPGEQMRFLKIVHENSIGSDINSGVIYSGGIHPVSGRFGIDHQAGRFELSFFQDQNGKPEARLKLEKN